MSKKIISYISIFLVIFNLFSSILFIWEVSAENVSKENSIVEKPQKVLDKEKQEQEYNNNTLILKFKKEDIKKVSLNMLQAKLPQNKIKNLIVLDKINLGVLKFDSKNENIDELIKELNILSEVEYVEKDFINELQYTGVTTTDTLSSELWYLESIKADNAWNMYDDLSYKTIVSVNDSGIFTDHIDLNGNLKDLSITCLSDTGSLISGGCPNNGWNFVSENNVPIDIAGHGTHVAGTIGAVENEIGVVGVTQNVEIIATKVGNNTLANSDIIQGTYFAINNGAKVINASYGGTQFSQAIYDVIEIAKNNNVLFIAAAGNNSDNNDLTPFYPAGYNLDNIISVGSIGKTDEFASYSNFGTGSVDLVAPGGDITNYDTGEGGILSTYINSTSENRVYTADVTNSGAVTISGTGSTWYLHSGDGYRTQERYTNYSGVIDSTISFNDTFSLSGVENASLDGYFNCNLGSNEGLTSRDDDYGDYLEVIIEDTDTGNELVLDRNDTSDYYSSYPILDTDYFKENLRLKFRFVADGDTDIGEGCNVDFPKINTIVTLSSNTYDYLQGTSMAAPVVTGLAAMLWSYNPELSYLEIKDIIVSSLDVLPNLSDKILTSGKINASNAIKELISRYGITKSGKFSTDIDTNYINLDGKTLSLSGSTIDFNGTGTVISLSGAIIDGTGTIDLGVGTNIYNDGSEVFGTSSDFDIIVSNNSGELVSNTGTIINGEEIKLNYTGSLTGTGLMIKLFSSFNGYTTLYEGEFNDNILIPISEDFNGTINSYVYKNGEPSIGIGSGVRLDLYASHELVNDITFNYVPSVFTGTISVCDTTGKLLDSCNNGDRVSSTGAYMKLESTFYPVDYTINGDIVGSMTGTLTGSTYVAIELTPGDGLKTLSGVLNNVNNDLSNSFTGTIELDQTAPLVTILANTFTGVAATSIDFSVSSLDSDFSTGNLLWSNNLNGNTGTGENYIVSGETSTGLIVSIDFTDEVGNNGTDNSEAYIIDNTGPDAPTNLFLNDGGNISTSNQTNLSLSGSGNISESGALVYYNFSESSGTGEVSGSAILEGDNFTETGINLSSLGDGTVDYEVYFIDILGNTGTAATGSSSKETVAPTGSIVVLNGEVFTNSTGSYVEINSSEYPVDYFISGDISTNLTGSLSSSGIVNIELLSGDGDKIVSLELTDSGDNTSLTYTGNIILDQTLPVINFSSHSDNEQLSGSQTILTGTVSDNYFSSTLSLNGSGTNIDLDEFSADLLLSEGNNNISYSLEDLAGNISNGTIDLVRLAETSNIYSYIHGTGSVTIEFETDISSSGEILYGTGESNLDNVAYSTDGFFHSIDINGLNESTNYFYKVKGYNNSYTGVLSSVNTFITANEIDLNIYTGSSNNTGSVLFSGDDATGTGIIFNGTGTINIISNDGNNSVELTLSGLTINSDSWDLLFNPPEEVSFSGVFTNTGYSHLEDLSYDIGNKDSELTLTGTEASVTIFVGAEYNGYDLGIFRSTDKGDSYELFSSCLVSSGNCTFTTDKFSLYTIASPSDTTPDSFSFSDVTSQALNTETISNTLTVSGINTGSIVSITNGEYSINSGTYTTLDGVIQNGDTINVKSISSTSYSTVNNTTLDIGGITDIFTVTTVSAPKSSGGGSSGGGGSSSYPTCLDTQLICKSVAGSQTVFKWYKKPGFTCTGGNLGKVCETPAYDDLNADFTEQLSILEIESNNKINNPILIKLLNQKKKSLIDIESNFSKVDYLGKDIKNINNKYRLLYNNWLTKLSKADVLFTEKNINEARVFLKEFLKEFNDLEKYNDKIKIRSLDLNGEEVNYIKYDNRKIQKIQILLFNNLKKKTPTVNSYELVNKVVHNLNILLTNKSLTKDNIKTIREETISIYKEYLKEYRKLAKKSTKNVITKITTKEVVSNENIYIVNVHSVKLKRDSELKYFHAMLEEGDKLKLISRNGETGLIEVEILTSRITNYIGRKGFVLDKFVKKQ